MDEIYKKYHNELFLYAVSLSRNEERAKDLVSYKLAKYRDEAIMVEVAVPEQRWEIEFLDDSSIDVEKFINDKEFYDADELEILFREFSN